MFWVKGKPAMTHGGTCIIMSVAMGNKESKTSEEGKSTMTYVHACDVKSVAKDGG
jgi:hypothetical protein